MRTAFIDTLIQLAKKDDTVFLITPDMGYSVLEKFRDEFPNQFLNSGIAEQNTISVAAGLASSGYTVFVYSIIPFVTMRCFEQVRLDLAYNNTNVKLVGIGAGLTYGSLGVSHHAIEDIAIMRSIPNMTVLCPGDPIETRELVKRSYEKNGPVYIRLGKNGEADIHDANTRIEIGKSIEITQGTDFALITTSNTLELGKQWVDEWKNENLSVSLISMPSIKPFDNLKIDELLSKQMPVMTLEEHNIIGGLGSCVAEIIATSEKSVPFKRVGINDTFSHSVGNHNYQRKMINFNEKPSVDFLKK